MTQAFGSPKTPRTVGCGRKPGNAYASHSRRCRFDKFAMRKSSQFRAIEKTSLYARKMSDLPSKFSHSTCPLILMRGAKFYHPSGISQAISSSACDAVFAAIDAALAAGVKVAYDCNFKERLWPLPRARGVIGATIRLRGYFLISLEERKRLRGCVSSKPS